MGEKTREETLRFERRDILKMITGVPAAAILTASPLAVVTATAAPPQSPGPDASESYIPKALNPHEWRTIGELSDLIIPADDRSCSASEARVPEFIDSWLNLKQGRLLDEIRGGLTWLDMECNRSFGFDFADCPASRQKQMLDRIAYPEKAAPEDSSAAAFFNDLRDLVVSGFFTSRMGISDLPYVGNEPQQAWNGCPAPVLAKLGVGGSGTEG